MLSALCLLALASATGDPPPLLRNDIPPPQAEDAEADDVDPLRARFELPVVEGALLGLASVAPTLTVATAIAISGGTFGVVAALREPAFGNVLGGVPRGVVEQNPATMLALIISAFSGWFFFGALVLVPLGNLAWVPWVLWFAPDDGWAMVTSWKAWGGYLAVTALHLWAPVMPMIAAAVVGWLFVAVPPLLGSTDTSNIGTRLAIANFGASSFAAIALVATLVPLSIATGILRADLSTPAAAPASSSAPQAAE